MSGLRQRQPRVKDPAYMAWIARSPCLACLTLTGRMNIQVHVAHLRAGSLEHGKRHTGAGEKPSDVWTVPLCPAHHLYAADAQHDIGEEAFYARLGVCPFDLCLALQAQYATGQPAAPVIIHFAALGRRNREAAHG